MRNRTGNRVPARVGGLGGKAQESEVLGERGTASAKYYKSKR